MPDYGTRDTNPLIMRIGTARCDFPGGSAALLYNSIRKIYELGDELRVFVGHDYAPANREHKFDTTLAEEKRSNKHVTLETTSESKNANVGEILK
jgi:glyoxylase-like metal-dependent hydrolase (beta-lactamase superfamily II)